VFYAKPSVILISLHNATTLESTATAGLLRTRDFLSKFHKIY